MTTAELQTKWGAYTDTNKLVDDIMALLTKYSHRNTEHGVCVMLDTYFTNKEPLIQLLKEVDGFDSNLRLIIHKDFDRLPNADDIERKISSLRRVIEAGRFFLSKTDDAGKTFTDYLKVGVMRFDIKQLGDYEFIKKLKTVRENLDEFDDDGYTRKSREKQGKFSNATYIFDKIASTSLSETNAAKICEALESKKYPAGLKTSRAFNRMCEELGVTAHKQYNKWFAEYSDLVAGGTRALDFVVSLNPYDYLTMSFGNSWSSCHTIDKSNHRGMPNNYSGAYCGGTTSYMLDANSIITYVIEKGGDPQTCGKIYRNMFHYEKETLVQGRVYPQGNDGATDLYEIFREYMHNVLNTAIKPEDSTWVVVTKGDCSEHTASSGAHYTDYMRYGDCNVSHLRSTTNGDKIVHIGHRGICPYCGETYTRSDRLSHECCSITE